ncbi:DUF247 domain protein [Medicago truncatula]|uniref:DUF247 domain protein n=1 Tax=Medicago truncatula TaxID=3880 RepID=G7KKF3_MEDTR|nr:DUF247 domain protein [Medicago truncatula]
MVALEQCYYPHESYITDYVVFDYLINTGTDVDILVRSKILENLLGDSHSAAKLFNDLCENVNISSHFSILCKDLNDFYSNPWHELNLKASLRHDRCNTILGKLLLPLLESCYFYYYYHRCLTIIFGRDVLYFC